MSEEPREPAAEAVKETWETPVLEVRGNLLDITSAAAGPGNTDFLFADINSV